MRHSIVLSLLWSTCLGSAAFAAVPAPSMPPAAAAAPAVVTLPLPWKQGVSVAYRSIATQDRVRGGKHLLLTTKETLRIEVLEVNPGGVVLRWSNDSPVVEASGDAPTLATDKAMVDALAARFGGMAYEVEVNARGEFTGLRNWRALSAAMREVMLPVLVAQAKARPELAGESDEALRARFAPVLEKLSGQAATNASLGREAGIYNYFVGASMTPGEPREYDDVAPSPWSADLIPTHGRFELLAVDDRAGTATIHWTQAIDPEKGRAVVLRSIEALAGKPVPEDMKASLVDGVKLQDEATVVLDRASGLPLRLEHSRQVTFGGASTRNTWTLERIATP